MAEDRLPLVELLPKTGESWPPPRAGADFLRSVAETGRQLLMEARACQAT